MTTWSKIVSSRERYDRSLQIARLGQKLLPIENGMIRRLPPPFNGWTTSRDLKPVAGESFNELWQRKYS